MNISDKIKDHIVGYSVLLVSATVAFCVLVAQYLHTQVLEAKDATIEKLRTDLTSANETRMPDFDKVIWKKGTVSGTNSIYFEVGTNKYHITIPNDPTGMPK